MVGHKLGASPLGVALGGPSNLINGDPRWKREFDDLVDEALFKSERGIFSDSAGKQIGRFLGGEFRLFNEDIT